MDLLKILKITKFAILISLVFTFIEGLLAASPEYSFFSPIIALLIGYGMPIFAGYLVAKEKEKLFSAALAGGIMYLAILIAKVILIFLFIPNFSNNSSATHYGGTVLIPGFSILFILFILFNFGFSAILGAIGGQIVIGSWKKKEIKP